MKKIHRFIGNFDTSRADFVLDDPEVLHQIRSVLKIAPGEQVAFCDGNLKELTCALEEYGEGIARFVRCQQETNENESRQRVVLCCAILKKDNFELVVQKATEVGVAEILPIRAKRTVKQNLNQKRLETIVKEAAEQSGRGILPVLHDPLDFEDALARAARDGTALFFDGGEKSINAKDASVRGTVYLFIGPEGGWDTSEREHAAAHGAQIVSLGSTTLRAETAAIVASYLFSR